MGINTAFVTDCPTCGKIKVPLLQVNLHATTDGKRYYTYICPVCHKVRGDESVPSLTGFLISGGVELKTDMFFPEILEVHDGPSITYNDILDLHMNLKRAPSTLMKELEESLPD